MLSSAASKEIERALTKLYAIRDVNIEFYAAGQGSIDKLKQVQAEIRLLEEIADNVPIGGYGEEDAPQVMEAFKVPPTGSGPLVLFGGAMVNVAELSAELEAATLAKEVAELRIRRAALYLLEGVSPDA